MIRHELEVRITANSLLEDMVLKGSFTTEGVGGVVTNMLVLPVHESIPINTYWFILICTVCIYILILPSL